VTGGRAILRTIGDVCSLEQTGFVLKAASRSIGSNGSLQAATKTTIRGEIATWRMEL